MLGAHSVCSCICIGLLVYLSACLIPLPSLYFHIPSTKFSYLWFIKFFCICTEPQSHLLVVVLLPQQKCATTCFTVLFSDAKALSLSFPCSYIFLRTVSIASNLQQFLLAVMPHESSRLDFKFLNLLVIEQFFNSILYSTLFLNVITGAHSLFLQLLASWNFFTFSSIPGLKNIILHWIIGHAMLIHDHVCHLIMCTFFVRNYASLC